MFFSNRKRIAQAKEIFEKIENYCSIVLSKKEKLKDKNVDAITKHLNKFIDILTSFKSHPDELLEMRSNIISIINKPYTKSGNSLLHLAAKEGRLDFAKALIISGADVNRAAQDSGFTPLHYAAKERKASICRLLVKFGAKTTAKDIEGKTPIQYAKNDSLKAVIIHTKPAGKSTRHVVRGIESHLADISGLEEREGKDSPPTPSLSSASARNFKNLTKEETITK